MKKSYVFIFIGIIAIAIIGAFLYFWNSDPGTDSNGGNVARLATQVNVEDNNSSVNNQDVTNTVQEIPPPEPTEEELSVFSTTILDTSSGRLNNIRLTCDRLNGTTVSNGETFSFCNTLGPSTEEKGYQKAKVIAHGDTIQALGGGNCQVASTLYNAVLEGEGLEVVERHEHGKDVGYVPEGKDATISYGDLDFRFKNSTGNDVKMYLSSDDETVTVRIVKLV